MVYGPSLLASALRDPKWKGEPISFSGNTDCYQPVERKERITRRALEVASAFRQPVGVITKNALVLRDLDILSEMAAHRLATVAISLTTLNEDLGRVLEPRTSSGANRLRTIEALSGAGIPVFVMVAPIIPALNEHELPTLLKAAADAGGVRVAGRAELVAGVAGSGDHAGGGVRFAERGVLVADRREVRLLLPGVRPWRAVDRAGGVDLLAVQSVR